MRAAAIFLAVLLALPTCIHATPARVAAIDNGNQIVPDDTDATVYYSLSPNFTNTLYAGYDSQSPYGNGYAWGWTFLGLGPGDLVLWWNKSYEADPLFESLSYSGGYAGLSDDPLSEIEANAWEPKEDRLALPETLLGFGYALPVSDTLTLALCFRIAQADATQSQGGGANGAPALLGASGAEYMGSLYPGMETASFTDAQKEAGYLASPQLSWRGERWNLNLKGDAIYNSIDNTHTEDVDNAGLTQSGSITQTLKDSGRLSWDVKPLVRIELDDSSSLVLRGVYSRWELGTVHTLTDSFSGAGLSAAQAEGIAQTNATTDLRIESGQVFLGWVKTWDDGKSLLVLGAGADITTTTQATHTWFPLAGAANFNTLTTWNTTAGQSTQWEVPYLMGAEISVAPWAKARAMVSRNLVDGNYSTFETDSFNNTATQTGHAVSTASNDANNAWVTAAGLGLTFGAFTLDTALLVTVSVDGSGDENYQPSVESVGAFKF